MSYALRDYQEEAVEAVLSAWKRGREYALIAHATGTGKTRSMVEIAKRRRGKVVVVAHMERLLEQTRQKMLLVEPSADIGIIGFGKAEWGHRITLAGPQTLLASEKKRLLKLAKEDIKTVIADECFPAGTLIDGKPIENIKIGDFVTSFNEKTGCFEQKPVISLFQKKATTLLRIITVNGNEVLCTPNHPFYSLKGWVQADGLGYGNVVRTTEGWSKIIHIASHSYTGDVYNFEVEDNHTYTANDFVVHNCHHYYYNNWYEVIRAFPNAKKVGFTATHITGSGENVRDIRHIFGPILHQMTLPEGILLRWLSDIDYTRIHTGQRLRDDLLSNGDDFDQEELGLIINLPDRNDFIVHSAIERGVKNHRCLAFCATVAHSEELAACFRARGVKAASFTGLQTDEQCKALLDDFARGEINVLTSCKKLGEGVDIELVDMLLLCSKTRSQSIYLQQIGRGTRFVEGIKELCYVLDYVDNGMRHELEQMSLDAAIGLPPTPTRRRLRQALEEAIENDPELADRIRRGVDDSSSILTRPIRKDQIVYEQRKLINTYEWKQTSNGIYIAQVQHSTMVLHPKSEGNYDAYLFYKKSAWDKPAGKLVISNVPTSYAKQAVEQLGRYIDAGNGHFVDPSASWRKELPTEEQIVLLQRMRRRIPDTRGEAQDIINTRRFSRR